ncbi:hypothetical protein [Jiulongibacter sp. NS-SX5]|uniref:hypothetical protein n=1 Tax=Jiulongibacter sp. NS-SX5 TaxID=3463854 RepID=UPI004058C767
MSNPIIVIAGPARCGKSFLVDMLTQGSKKYHLNALDSHHFDKAWKYGGLSHDDDYIYLDDLSKKTLDLIYNDLQSDQIKVHDKGKAALMMKRPPIIITTELMPKEFINLKDAVIFRAGLHRKFIERQKLEFRTYEFDKKEVKDGQ